MKNDNRYSALFSIFKVIPLFLLLLICFACEDQASFLGTDDSLQTVEFSASSNAAVQDQGADRYIIVFDSQQVPGEDVRRTLGELSNRYKFQPEFVYQHTISGFAAVLSHGNVENLRTDNRVLRVTRDVKISLFPEPQHHQPDHGGGPPDKDNGDDEEDEETSDQIIPWGVERVGGSLSTSGNRAWVIDTGIDLDHADLNVNTTDGKNCVTRGKDSFNDGNGHGTHVSGTIAAIDNTIDVIGVTERTELVPVRVLDNSGSGFLSWIICGVDHVAANFSDGDVANMSLGGKTGNTDLDDAVISAADNGLYFTIASGNSGDDAADYTPARTGTHDNIYTVAAINQNDEFTTWSNFGDPVSYAAPGVAILSTWRGGGTDEKSGTSMAAPHIAGLLVLNQLCDDGSVTGTDGSTYLIPYRCNEEDLLASE